MGRADLYREALEQQAHLQKFKELVHRKLDEAGIDKCENEECRVGARLDLLIADRYDNRLAEELEKNLPAVMGAMKCCIDAHGPIDRGRVGSAAKRMISILRGQDDNC